MCSPLKVNERTTLFVDYFYLTLIFLLIMIKYSLRYLYPKPPITDCIIRENKTEEAIPTL